MRRLTVCAGHHLVIAVLVLTPLAHDGARAAQDQVVEGTILVPTAADECLVVSATTEWAARAGWLSRFTFEIEPGTRGQAFVLRPDTPADVDIRFDGGTGLGHQTRSLEGERGRVPANAFEATVCLFAGAATSFTYRAGPGVT